MEDRQTLGPVHKKPRFIRPDTPRPASPKRKNCELASQGAKRSSTRVDDEDDYDDGDNNPGEPEEGADREKATQAATGLASLAINNNRRRGLYGARAFGLKPLQPEIDENRVPAANIASPNPQSLRVDQSERSHHPPHVHQTKSSSLNQTRKQDEHTQKRVRDPPPSGLTAKPQVTCAPSNLRARGTDTAPSSQHASNEPAQVHPVTGGLRLPGGGRITRHTARLDEDRDHEGNLLPCRKQPFLGTARPRPIGTPLLEDLPDNFHSSVVQRRAVRTITKSKRKHSANILPPQAYVYQRTNDPNFNIFHGFLLYPELCFMLANHLSVKDLISLYAICADFHTIMDSRFTTVCLGQVFMKAPSSGKTFFFTTYKQLCRKDPEARIPHPDPSKAADKITRLIPSFRWVQMVIYREKLVHELMAVFAEYGCPLPARCDLAIKRMWFLMDMPSNALRVGAIHNHKLITDLDLYFAMAFFVKLDMICNDPVAPEKRDGLRKLMLSMPDGIETVHRVITRQRWRHRTDMMVAWVRHTLEIPTITENPNGITPEQLGVPSVLGVPVREVGLLKYEYFGHRGKFRTGAESPQEHYQFLLRPDQLVMREAIRRGLRFHKHVLRCVLYGYINPATLENHPPREWPRRIPEYNDEEYGINDAVGGIRASNQEEGGDPLLDVGDSYAGSRYTHKPEKPHDWAEQIKMANDLFLDYMEWWQQQEVPKQETDDLPAYEELRD